MKIFKKLAVAFGLLIIAMPSMAATIHRIGHGNASVYSGEIQSIGKVGFRNGLDDAMHVVNDHIVFQQGYRSKAGAPVRFHSEPTATMTSAKGNSHVVAGHFFGKASEGDMADYMVYTPGHFSPILFRNGQRNNGAASFGHKATTAFTTKGLQTLTRFGQGQNFRILAADLDVAENRIGMQGYDDLFVYYTDNNRYLHYAVFSRHYASPIDAFKGTEKLKFIPVAQGKRNNLFRGGINKNAVLLGNFTGSKAPEVVIVGTKGIGYNELVLRIVPFEGATLSTQYTEIKLQNVSKLNTDWRQSENRQIVNYDIDNDGKDEVVILLDGGLYYINL